MYHIAEALVRWIAPILSFTADEIWENLPGERADSVFLVEWYTHLPTLPVDNVLGREYWSTVIEVRDAVNRELENRRNQGELKGGLDAEVTLYCSDELAALLGTLGEELRFVLITSAARIEPLAAAPATAAATELEGLALGVAASAHAKCERCWHRREDVGQHAVHPGLCGRCIENVDGDGEQRRFA
jgi:isoleucyl-tRNA synthetase